MSDLPIGALKLAALIIVIVIIGDQSAGGGLLFDFVLFGVAGFALFKPLPRIGLGHRGLALCVAAFIAFPAMLFHVVEYGSQLREEKLARLEVLKETDQEAYFAELKKLDRDRWLSEIRSVNLDAYQAEMKIIQAEERRQAAAATAEANAEREEINAKHCKGRWNGAEALVVSQLEYIKPRLRSPSTADFPGYTDDEVSVTFLNDCTFVVRTYVDAQNAFGATIRTRFLVKLQRDIDNPDAWRLIDLFTLD